MANTVHPPQVPRSLAAQKMERFAKETKWLAENGPKYIGRWVALEGDQLLTVGDSAKEVYAIVGNLPSPPLVVQIPEDTLPFAGW